MGARGSGGAVAWLLWAVVAVGLASACADDDDDTAPGQDAGGQDASADAAPDAGPPATLEVRMAGEATPVTRTLLGEVFVVHGLGFPPGADVTLRTHLSGFLSEVVFPADAEGAFDTGSTAASSGSYEGVDPDGIVWSMAPVEGEEPDGSLTLDFEATVDGEVAATASLDRFRLADGAQAIAVDDPAIVGTFYVPAGEGPFPALLVFGGSEGGRTTGENLGQRFASRGIAALGVAYFAADGVPADLFEIPLEYFGHALDWLEARPEVDPGRVGVMGGSRGGELALLLGATFPEVVAVVAYVPSGVVWGGFAGDTPGAAWTWQGVPLPDIPIRAGAATGPGPDDETVYYSRRMFEESLGLASPAELDAATIRVERTAGPILLIGGDDDQLWPSCVLAEVARARLEETGHLATWGDELICYPEAGHGLLRAGVPSTVSIIRHPVTGMLYELGGTPAGNAHAGRAAWTRIDAFLAGALAP